jgi:membrane protein insertase Oxa1/YidC/SpoIIIJ
LVVLSVASESFLWISNLSIPDPTYALPTAVAALYLAGVELGSDGVSKEQMGRGIWFMRALSLGFFYFAAQWSALFGLYLGTNSAASLVLAQVFKLQGVRKFFDIPRTPPPKLKADNSVAEAAAQKAAGGELALKVMKAQKKAAVLSDAVSGAKLPTNAVSQQDLIRQRREAAKKVL